MGYNEEKAAQAAGICCAACCVGVVVVGVLLFWMSLVVLEATEMGLDYNQIAVYVEEDTLYTAGRHFLGIGHKFIVYPKDQQTTQFPGNDYPILAARTMDGLKVNLNLQYQYRLIPELDEVMKLYYTWGYRHKYCFALA